MFVSVVQSFLLLQVIMPGYCVAGTMGHKILSGQRKIELENRQTVNSCLWNFFLTLDVQDVVTILNNFTPVFNNMMF